MVGHSRATCVYGDDMKKIRVFNCRCCLTKFERFEEDEVKEVQCNCGGVAVRMLSSPKYFSNTVGNSPSVK